MQAFSAQAMEWINQPLIDLGGSVITPLVLVQLCVILVSMILIPRLVKKALLRGHSLHLSFSESAAYGLARISQYVIVTIAMFIGFSVLGIDLTNIAIVMGALSVGLGFGLQGIANNFVSGLIILFERNLNVGDFIQLPSGVSGTIREISIRSSLINTQDNLDVLVPNAELIGSMVTNWTLNERFFRVRVPFGVAYKSDKDLVRKAALEAAALVPHTLNSDGRFSADVWLVGFGDSTLDFELVVWVNPRAVQVPGSVIPAYLWEIETKLREYKIEIPFPQRDVHLKSSPAA